MLLTRRFAVLCCLFFCVIGVASGQQPTLSGTVRQQFTGEPLSNASILFSGFSFGTTTDSLGRFSLSLPPRTYQLVVRLVGYRMFTTKVVVDKSMDIDIELQESSQQLDEVVITSEKEEAHILRPRMGIEKIAGKTFKKLPNLMGEADVIRSILLLPGVSTVGEGASGFNVRGGNTDQNLILLDGVPLYNTSHLFGFFTAFNADMVQEASLYKGNVPASYGGRASAVLDVRLREGNFDNFHAEGGIGPISSRLLVEGPLWKQKTALILAARGSFSNFYLRYFPNAKVKNSAADFYDVNARLTHRFSPTHRLTLAAYTANDRFRFGFDTTYLWNTSTLTLKDNWLIYKKLSSNFTAYASRYQYGIEGAATTYEYAWQPQLTQYSLRQDFRYELSEKIGVDMGGEWIRYASQAGSLQPRSAESVINALQLPTDHSQEWAVFANQNLAYGKWMFDYGLRWANYALLGPYTSYQYAPQQPRSLYTLQDTLQVGAGRTVKSYGGLEPRLSVSYAFSPDFSLKFGYNKMQQFIHLLSNTMAVSPADVWKSSNAYVPPQIAHQWSVGAFQLFRDYREIPYEVSAEIYYKSFPQLVDYVDGASLYLNPLLETELLTGKGWAYGAELLLKKPRGRRLTGWISYVYARTFRQVEASDTQLGANFGKAFPSNFDTPHNLKFILNQRWSNRVSFNTNFTFATGRPITYPNGRYKLYAFSGVYDYLVDRSLIPRFAYVTREFITSSGQLIRYLVSGEAAEVNDGYSTPSFTLRNAERIPNYMRLDVGLTIDSNPKKRFKSSINLAVYNILGRQNVYSVYFRSSTGLRNQAKTYKLSILGAAIPSITYNFSF